MSSEASVAQTTCGTVQGVMENGVRVFRGIPYGASTAGFNRFLPPKPPHRWDGIRPAVSLGAIAPQPNRWQPGPGLNEILGFDEPSIQSEDCLVLNVFVSDGRETARRPVMVWLHGGAFGVGSGGNSMYSGVDLVRRGDVVVVTVNHRLGALGLLHLGDLGGSEYAVSGLVGMLDLVAALTWVRDNIGAFGGDPGCVTIFGESGGGTKVSMLLGMPMARRLFHRAIIQSAPNPLALDRETAQVTTRAYMKELGVSTLEQLVEAPVERLLAVQEKLTGPFGQGGPYEFQPVLGHELPRQPFDPDVCDSATDVPLIIGTNKDEMTVVLGASPNYGRFDERSARSLFTPPMDGLYDSHRLICQKEPPSAVAVAVASETLRMPAVRVAERMSELRRVLVFMYLFSWESPYDGGRYGAMHGLEIPFVFDHPDAMPLSQSGQGQAELAAAMSDAWIAFARSGSPDHDGIPEWREYDADRRATMVFDVECRLEEDSMGAEREAWMRTVGFNSNRLPYANPAVLADSWKPSRPEG